MCVCVCTCVCVFVQGQTGCKIFTGKIFFVAHLIEGLWAKLPAESRGRAPGGAPENFSMMQVR